MKTTKKLLSLILALSMVLSFAVTPAFAAEKAEYEVDYETVLQLGTNNLTLNPDAVTTVYEFCPDEAGIYKFEVADSNALVGYWGAGSFFVSDQTEDKSNVLVCTLENAGPSIMVGISGVASCKLTITRTGDAVVVPTYEKIDYVNKVTPKPYTLPELSDELVDVDVTDKVADSAKLGEDGYYHLNSVDGPILFADLDSSILASMSQTAGLKVTTYFEDRIPQMVDYMPAWNEYVDCKDSTYGVYPLTEDLITMFREIGNDKGFYDPSAPGYLFAGKVVDAETAWLDSCCYAESYVSAEGTTPSEPEGDKPGASESEPIWLNVPEDTITVAAGQTAYYTARVSGMIMTLKGKNVTVAHNGKTYKDSNGVITLVPYGESMFQPPVFAITNNAKTDATYAISFVFPVGDSGNPAAMVIGENSAELKAGDTDGYFFSWTATETGTLTITMPEKADWSYTVNNLTAGTYGANRTSGDTYKLFSQTIKIEKGDEIQVVVNTFDPADEWNTPAGKVSFTASLKAPSKQFGDLDQNAWYISSFDFMVGNGFMNGVGGNKMTPGAPLTRAMLVKMLYEIVGAPSVQGKTEPFTDVEKGQWFYDAVVWAYNEGAVNGLSETSFGPNVNITREQVATILYRYLDEPKVSGDLKAFADGKYVSDWATKAMIWATQNGIINGVKKDGKMCVAPRPLSDDDIYGAATRAEAATILARWLQN